jgi:hypothetical protein
MTARWEYVRDGCATAVHCPTNDDPVTVYRLDRHGRRVHNLTECIDRTELAAEHPPTKEK